MAQNVTCLIVDDLDENLLALAALLDAPDVEVLQARSGAEALELLLVHPVALAFLDVQMPGMDGFELAELMRGSERTRHVPIIFVTAGTGDEKRLFKGYDSGAVDFLYKPIEPRVLKSKAAVFFQLYRQKQQLAEELRERTETLRLNEFFTAILGHDLRGPLSAITMSAMVMQKRATDDGSRNAAARMISSARSMGRMIEDMLDLARGRLGGGIPVRRVDCDLGPPLARVIDECSAAHPDQAVQREVTGDVTGSFDPDRVAQAASNLIGNALRHGTPGQPVDVMLDGRDAERVVLTIGNEGTIPPELLPTLFDPFRGDTQKMGRSGGLGIGLYIVEQIVRSHGGTIFVRSVEDGRTVFTMTLPRRG